MIIFNAKKFLEDFNIQFTEGGKNWQPGWLQVTCPICADRGFHGGFNLSKGYYNCWKCGNQPVSKIISKLINCGYQEGKKIETRYKIASNSVIERKKSAASKCKIPIDCRKMSLKHKAYLESRRFNCNQLEKQWELLGTGPIGAYKFRIIAPIIVDGVMISYQGRDITNKQELRYKACAIENEVIHHKHVVYGIDYVKEDCVIVEGITDVWRIGPGAVATFGTSFTIEQLLFLKGRVKGGTVLFDSDSTEKGTNLMCELNALGMSFDQIILQKGDPGDLDKDSITKIMSIIQ